MSPGTAKTSLPCSKAKFAVIREPLLIPASITSVPKVRPDIRRFLIGKVVLEAGVNGAKPVFSAMDILSEYEYLYGDLIDFSKAETSLSQIPYVEYRKAKKTDVSEKPIVKEKSVEEKCTKEKKSELDDSFSNEAKKVYSVLSSEPTHVDDILRQTALKMSDVLSALTELELMGEVEGVEGKKYKV